MKKSVFICLAVMAVLMAASCRKDFYNPSLANEITKATFHNDTVDERHTWSLLKDGTVRVKPNVANVSRIDLLTENPYTSFQSEVLATSPARQDEVVELTYCLPLVAETLWADAVTTSGAHVVTELYAGQQTADFSSPYDSQGQTPYDTENQSVLYCYCNTFPLPSTSWDFNDCVLRLSKRVLNDTTLRLTVTIEAMGTLLKTAAAIRLQEVDYDEVASVNTVGSRSFVRDENIERTFITDGSPLLRGKDGAAVINLFDDGHLAFYTRMDPTGVYYRYYYNVSHSTNNTTGLYRTFATPTVTYDIRFKQPGTARTLTYTAMDPFIVCSNNGLLVEIHKYRYKYDQVLMDYMVNPLDFKNSYSWALEIPFADFRYPLEGYAMGSKKGNGLAGCYSWPYHSFGEWTSDRNTAQDWYLYPPTSGVY